MKNRLAILLAAALAAPCLVSAENLRGRWGLAGFAGGASALGDSTVKNATDAGASYGGEIRWGLSDDWGAGLSYSRLTLNDDGSRAGDSKMTLQPVIASLVFQPATAGPWSPHVGMGVGAAAVDTELNEKTRASFSARAGAGVDYFAGHFLSFSLNLYYYHVSSSEARPFEVSAFVPAAGLTFWFGPVAADPERKVSAPPKAKPAKPSAAPKRSAGRAAPLGTSGQSPRADGDSDGDGVSDAIDQCPGTPKPLVVNPAGCPSDSDKDGVWDGIDKCPGTPPGRIVDKSGCLPLATQP